MNHRRSVDLIEILVDSIRQFLFGLNPNSTKHLICHLSEETFDHIQPGTVFGGENEFKSARNRCKECSGFFGCMSRMVIEYQADLITLGILAETIFVKGELRLFESMPYSLVLGLLHCSRRCKNLKMVEYHFISNFPLLNRQDNQCNVGSGLCPASLRWNRTVCLSQIGAGTQTKFHRMIADAKFGRSKHWRLNSYNRIMLNAVSNPLNSETIRDFERLLIASELIFLWFFHF